VIAASLLKKLASPEFGPFIADVANGLDDEGQQGLTHRVAGHAIESRKCDRRCNLQYQKLFVAHSPNKYYCRNRFTWARRGTWICETTKGRASS
jgi:hypothetical protein